MATTENLHTGDASKTKFSFTFPYLNQTDVEVYKYVTNAWVKQTVTTHYTFDNATTIKFGSAPAAASSAEQALLGNNKNIKIKRNTSGDSLAATFYPGSAIRAGDLNDNYTQNLYVTQEASNAVTDANTEAAAAVTTADTAKSTADDAADDVKRWIKDGDGTDTAGDEDDADFTARPLKPQGVPYAVAQAASAVSTAASANTTAGNAVTTANTASTNATNAVNTANSAQAAVSSVLPYTIVANKAALLAASVSEDDIYEVTDTTDLEDLGGGSDIIWVNDAGSTSGQDIAALKPNVTWDSGITLKMKKYGTNNTDRKWIFQSYFANDPESKYIRAASAVLTGDVVIDNDKSLRLSEADSNGAAYVGLKGPTDMGSSSSYTVTLPTATPTANQVLKADASTPTTLTWAADSATDATKMPLAGGTFTGAVNIGVDDTGVDCKFFGDTASAYLLWDTSADSLVTGGAATIDIVKDKLKIGGTAVTTTAAELNLLDGKTAVGDALLASDQNWTGAQRGNVSTLTSAATITIDFGASNNFKLETGHAAIAFANPTTEVAGQSGSIFIVQGSTTCAAPTWGNQWFFSGGTAPSFTGTTGKIGRVDYIVQEAGKIHCVATDNLALTS